MAGRNARGAIRASRRRRNLKRLIVTPPKTRKAMLSASALVGGALGNLAAFVAKPRPAARSRAAQWTKRGGVAAAGIVGSFLMFPAGVAVAANCSTSGSDPVHVMCADGNTLSYNGSSSVISSIDPGLTINGVRITEQGNSKNVDLHVDADWLYSTTVQSSSGDAIDITASPSHGGYTGIINFESEANSYITTSGSHGGDGIHIESNKDGSTGTITVASYSTISVQGDGIHVEETGKSYHGSQGGDVTVTSYGTIYAGGNGHSDDAGISVETSTADITINAYNNITMAGVGHDHDHGGHGGGDDHGGGQTGILAQSDSGDITVNVGNNASDPEDELSSTITSDGDGVLILSGDSSEDWDNYRYGNDHSGNYQNNQHHDSATQAGDVTVTVDADSAIYVGGVGIAIGQESGSDHHDHDSDYALISVTNDGEIVSGEDGVLIGGLSEDHDGDVSVSGEAYHSNVEFTNTGWIESLGGDGVDINVGGSVWLVNTGHIEGDHGDGVKLQNGTTADIDNSSANSMIGSGWGNAGLEVEDFDQVTFHNEGGVTAGLRGADGVNISDISGWGTHDQDYAVYVDNEDGIIAGDSNGLVISDVNWWNCEGGDVMIDNSAAWSTGGLIVGVHGDGVNVSDVYYGNVVVDNRGTELSWVNLNGIDQEVYGDCWSLLERFANEYGYGDGYVSAGIYGEDDGVSIHDVQSGDVLIYNEDGLIAGDEGDGINVRGVDGTVMVDNSYSYDGDWSGTGGIIWGGDNGIEISSANAAEIYNALGWIEGDSGDGILINCTGVVTINNGETDGEGWYNGGTIIGAESAIAVYDASSVVIENGGLSGYGEDDEYAWGGLILGGGGEYAAIDLSTSSDYGDGATIANYGIIATADGELFDPWDLSGNFYDTFDIAAAVEADSVDSSLVNYGVSAANTAIYSSGGATDVTNYGLIVGAVDLNGASDDGADWYVGNTLTNYGFWFTSGYNTVNGDGGGTIYNEGLIQTAFGQTVWDPDAGDAGAYVPVLSNTTFDVSDFYNDDVGYTGILSSLDGQVGDTITVDGNFHGGSTYDETEYGVYSIVALDAYLDRSADSGGSPAADELIVTGTADGTTGLLINNTNPNDLNSGEMNNDGILVVQVNGAGDSVDNPNAGSCFDVACVDGDTFYISSASNNYVEINGVGMIQQGSFYAWYLTERADEPNANEDGYYLVTTELPTADQAPAVTTGFVNIFYAGTDLVSDHLYGGHFPDVGSGGGGDDVTPQGPSKSTKDTAVWARVAGSWSSQDSSVQANATTYDTSFKQDTYTLLGGVDMSPNGGGSGFRFGAYGGYVTSSLAFSSYGTSGKYTGGEVGAYAAYTQGGFYADAQVDADFLNVNYNANVGSSAIDANTNGTTIGVLANVGNRFYQGKNFFEPLASFSYANMTLGTIDTGSATIAFSDSQSIRGGIGGRIGTTVKNKDGSLTEFTLLGRLWNEFAGDSAVTVSDGTNTNTFTNDTGGLYEEVEGTVTFADTKSNVSTYVSGGAMFGSDSTTLNAKAGVRKEF